MSLLGLFLILILLGVILWAITTYLPMDARIKGIIIIVGVIVAALVTLDAFGVLDALQGVRVPRVDP